METDVISFYFCQLSDLNLDSRASLNLHLSPAQRKQRSQEAVESLASAMKLASSHDVDAVLIPGNIFDSENITTSMLASVQRIFSMLEDIPVFIAPGPKDCLYSDSVYAEAALKAKGLEAWSENVHIFGSKKFQSKALPERDSIRISGIGLTRKNAGRTPDVPVLSDSERRAINVLLLPLGFDLAGKQELPDELIKKIENAGYSYVAFSGPSNQVILQKSDGLVYAAAAGTFIAQTEKEPGARTAIFANLDRHMGGKLELNINPEEFDPRRIVSISFDFSKNNPDTTASEFKAELEKSGVRKESDILLVKLSGYYPFGQKSELIDPEMENAYFHLKVDDESRPDFLESMSEKNTIETRYLEIMNSLKDEALKMPEGSERNEKLKILEDALYYGFEAIREGKVSIKNAD